MSSSATFVPTVSLIFWNVNETSSRGTSPAAPVWTTFRETRFAFVNL